MGEQRTLIAYFTKGGVTRENTEIIAGILRDDFGHQVDVVDLWTNRRPDIGPYQVVIVGSGIRIGMWYGRPKRFLKNKALADKKVAIFLSSLTAGNEDTYDQGGGRGLRRALPLGTKDRPHQP
jgi:menaquinone-dependent protoporphyrinogen oxidase